MSLSPPGILTSPLSPSWMWILPHRVGMLLLTWRWADPGLFPTLQPVQDVGFGAWITWEWDRGRCAVPDHRKAKDWDIPAGNTAGIWEKQGRNQSCCQRGI